MLFCFKDYSQSVNQYDYSEPVYFVKVEAKGICEEVMTDTYGHMLNSVEKYLGKYLQTYDRGSQIEICSSRSVEIFLLQMRHFRRLLDLIMS